ncbi:PAS domain S-box protein, partial [Candidatus Dependentiae bacterium]|nr:PAS domain S-box protein [Candidatus Dependentiae bacterium]
MIIHSYHPEFWWVHSVDKGMLEVFSEHNFNAEYFYEFLDTKRFLNDFFNTYFSQYKKYLSIKFSAQKPDLIITVDDDALNFMKSCRTEIFGKDIPIVFCGVNKPFDYSILKGKSITGVMEILDIEETIDSIIKIHPDVKRLAVITDLTTNGKNNRLLLEQLEKKYYQKLKFVFIDRENKGLTLDELINEIKNLDNNTAIYLADFFNDRNGYIDQDIVIPLICRNASRPVYSPYIMMFRYGTVGGKLNDPELQGRKAAELTLKYFSGMKIEDIPVFTESINKFMFNFNELKRWKINESELPENSVIINKMPKWFDRHFKYIFPFIFIILALIIVIFVIVINGKKLKRKEIELSISEKKYRLLFESESDAIILIDMDSLKIIEANNAATDLYKYSKDELIGMPAFQLSNEPEKTEYRIKNSEQLEFIRIRYHKDKNGFVFPVEITARIFALDDKKLLLIAVRDIRDRIEREQALKEKTDELDRFFNLSLDLMCIADFNGFFKRLNPAWKAVLGYDEKELLSKKFIDFIHPDDLPATYSSIKKLEEGEDIINFINRYRCFDGSYKFIEWRSTPYKKNMIYAAARDITEHIQAEKAARESEKKYRLLFENMSSGFALHTIICDENENPVDYRFIEINEPFERLTGLKKKDIIGKTVTEALPLTEKYWIETYGKVALTGNHIIFENYSAALEKYYECIAFSPEKYQFAVLFNDITDRKKIEHEREKLINELEIKNAEMERFVYTVSHDLRSPLITISSFVGLLAQDITKNDLTQVHNDLT